MSRGARDLYRDPLYYDSIFDVRTAEYGGPLQPGSESLIAIARRA